MTIVFNPCCTKMTYMSWKKMTRIQSHGAIIWPRAPSQHRGSNGHIQGQTKGRGVTVMDGMGSAYHKVTVLLQFCCRFRLSTITGQLGTREKRTALSSSHRETPESFLNVFSLLIISFIRELCNRTLQCGRLCELAS